MQTIVPVFAETESCNPSKTELTELGKAVYSIIPAMKEMVQEQYVSVENEVKETIKKNSLDYEYTMLDFTQFGDPTSEVNYNELIAAYTTAIYLDKASGGLLCEIPLITVDITEELVPDDVSEKYAHTEFYVMGGKDLLSYYGLDPDDSKINTIYQDRLHKLETSLTNEVIQQTIPEVENDTDTSVISQIQYFPSGESVYPELTNDVSTDRQKIISTAYTLLGRVPYQWGGKATKPGYDGTWWSYLISGKQKGLDCSGFVQWVFMTAGYGKDVTDGLVSTATIRESLLDISKDELLPGDIGLLNNTGNTVNHTGIYVGDGKWIHCSSGKKTVVVSDFHFKYFKRAPIGGLRTDYQLDNDLAEDNIKEDMAERNGITVTVTNIKETEESVATSQESEKQNATVADYNTKSQDTADIRLLAQLIHHEAGNQGLNGMIAVGEVVMNRVKSSKFPNSIRDVIYQNGQFSGVSSISSITPSETELTVAQNVLAGNMSILQDDNVLYFRNPSYAGLSASDQVNWGKLPWYTSINQHAFYKG